MNNNKKKKIIIHCSVVLILSMAMLIINKESIEYLPFTIIIVAISYSVFLFIFWFIKNLFKQKKNYVLDSLPNSISEETMNNSKQSEVNFSSNKTVLDALSRFAIADLIKYNRIADDNNIEVTFGYAYQDTDGKINALYKVEKNNNTFYYVCEKGTAYGVNITEKMYHERINNTFMNHKCLHTLEGADTNERTVTYELCEENLINDREAQDFVAGLAIKYLEHNKKISDFSDIVNEFGYIYSNNKGMRESLFKVIKDDNVFYFLLKNEFELNLLEYNEEQFKSEIEKAKKEHRCLNSVPEESKSAKSRREKNNSILHDKGIVCPDKLTCFDEHRQMKDIDVICKKAIASLLTIQVACDINNKKDVDNSIEIVNKLLNKYGVMDYLNSKEMRIMNKSYTVQDAIDMDWEYETYWSLCWILGLVDDISDGAIICDCGAAIGFVLNSMSIDDFKSKCKLRSKEEILNMEDLYFRYVWAINEKKVNPNASIGNLNSSIVIERYRGLKWVLSDIDDWYDLSLNA